MSNFPAIPDPNNTTESMLETILALKQAVEMLTGQRGVSSTTALTGATASQAEAAPIKTALGLDEIEARLTALEP